MRRSSQKTFGEKPNTLEVKKKNFNYARKNIVNGV